MSAGMRCVRAALFGLLACALCALPVRATEETRQALEDAKAQHEQRRGELSEREISINHLNAERDTLMGQISDLNVQLTEVSESLEEIEGQIDRKEQEISLTSGELAEAVRIQQEQYAAMKKRVQFLYEKQSTLVAEMLKGSGSFAEFLNQNHYVESLASYDRRMLEAYMDNGSRIEARQESLAEDMDLLRTYQERQAAEQGRVSGLLEETTGQVRSYEGQINSAEEMVSHLEEQLAADAADIRKLEEKLKEEIRMSNLARKGSWRDISQIRFAEGDRCLLANIIYCEAAGEAYEGKLAVGAAVINRVRSGIYPDTVVGVIYQARQFEPVATGRLALALAEDRADSDCYRAADEAMEGRTNVGNCVYFRTPVAGLTGIRIGGHVFY